MQVGDEGEQLSDSFWPKAVALGPSIWPEIKEVNLVYLGLKVYIPESNTDLFGQSLSSEIGRY